MDTTNDTKNPPEQKPPSFLDLPGELRNRMYNILLVENEPIQVLLREEDSSYQPGLWQPRSHHIRYSLPRIQRTTSSKHYLAITGTCKQVREESFSLFLGANTFTLKFGDHIPKTNHPGLWRAFTQTRTLHLRGWMSYLEDFKKHLNHVEVDLGLLKNDFDQTILINSMKEIKAAFAPTSRLVIAADITVQPLQTVGRPAVPSLRLTTSAKSLEEALRCLEEDVKTIRNWITSRDENFGGSSGYLALVWKHDSVRELERAKKRVEEFWRGLDGDPAWRWNGGNEGRVDASSVSSVHI